MKNKLHLLGAVCACAIGFSSNVIAASVSYGAWVVNSISGSASAGTISVSWYLPVIGSSDFSQGSVQSGNLNSSTTFAGNTYGVYLADNGTNLFTSWSMRNSNSIWLYGSESALRKNTDFYFYAGLTDPTMINDASIFTYSTTPDWTGIGGTIFFQEFAVVPIPPALLLFCSGLLGLIGIARKKAT